MQKKKIGRETEREETTILGQFWLCRGQEQVEGPYVNAPVFSG